MSAAVLLAGAAGVCAVGAMWEIAGTAAPAGVVAATTRLLAPLRRPGVTPTPDEHRRLVRTGAAVLLAGGWILSGPLLGVALCSGGPWAVRRVLVARHQRWQAQVALATPLVARALADALSGGHSVRGAVAEVASAGGVGPAGAVLSQAAAALAAGQRTEVVLEESRTTVADPQWDTLVAAILLARDTGGDLGSLLRSLAVAGEQARRDEEDARTATAQARMTAIIVAALPLGALVLGELVDPTLLPGLLADPRSVVLLTLALVCQVGSLIAVRRIARVEAR